MEGSLNSPQSKDKDLMPIFPSTNDIADFLSLSKLEGSKIKDFEQPGNIEIDEWSSSPYMDMLANKFTSGDQSPVKGFTMSRGVRVMAKGEDSFDIDMVNTYLSIFLSKGKLSLACKLFEVFTSMGVDPVSYTTQRPIKQKVLKDGPAYICVFVSILRDIFKEETVEYVLALIDELLSANPKRARLFHDKLLWKGNWFIQEKSCKILSLIVTSGRPRSHDGSHANGASKIKKDITTIDDVLKALVDWLCSQLKNPSHPSRGIPTAVNCLATLLKEHVVRSSFVQTDGVKLLIPLISPASTQQSIQLLYETCLCVWLLSYYEPAVEYLATSRSLPRLIEVVKGSTKEKVVRVVILTLKNLLHKGTFGAQMVDLGLPQLVQNLKAQAWRSARSSESIGRGLKDNIKQLSSFDKYKQEVLLGHLDWSPMHKDPIFWRDNIANFEEHDFQILRVLITILDTSTDPRTLAVACYDLSQFIQYHAAGRIIVTDLKAKERVMKLMNHENVEVTKNALLYIQRLFPGAKYASFLQA
ncbi:v-type proton ATPase subunit H [Striga asiatica]|uniref:Vacuolar proton pump subunit H n=1 Tax=Striga asiatica TaxID=4170 RepID=A0A5A7REX8_STRAF|nr:v-type proton ATPase subunit H [Striga asiatica]